MFSEWTVMAPRYLCFRCPCVDCLNVLWDLLAAFTCHDCSGAEFYQLRNRPFKALVFQALYIFTPAMHMQTVLSRETFTGQSRALKCVSLWIFSCVSRLWGVSWDAGSELMRNTHKRCAEKTHQLHVSVFTRQAWQWMRLCARPSQGSTLLA